MCSVNVTSLSNFGPEVPSAWESLPISPHLLWHSYSCPQHEHGSSGTMGAEARMRNLLIEQGNWVMALHFLRGTTVPLSSDFVWNILKYWLKYCIYFCFQVYFLIFSGILYSQHFSMVINRYSSQVYTACAQNKKLSLPLQTVENQATIRFKNCYSQ